MSGAERDSRNLTAVTPFPEESERKRLNEYRAEQQTEEIPCALGELGFRRRLRMPRV